MSNNERDIICLIMSAILIAILCIGSLHVIEENRVLKNRVKELETEKVSPIINKYSDINKCECNCVK